MGDDKPSLISDDTEPKVVAPFPMSVTEGEMVEIYLNTEGSSIDPWGK